MKRTVYTVSVGIPAHNEQENIKNLLNSVIEQRGDNFKLEKIYVLCDGCTDSTAEKARELVKLDKRIKIIEDGRRKGKSQRLNHFYKLNNSDIAINFDADVTLIGDRVIQKMLRKFGDNVTMVSACNLPIKGKTFFQKITRAGDMLWFDIRSSYKKGQNIYNSSGCSTAITKDFAKKFRYPKGTIADQQYIYHKVKESGKKFRFAKNTLVLYRSPDNLEDYLLQAHRSLTEKYPIIDIVGADSEKEYDIPISFKLRGIFLAVIKDPIFTPLSLVLAVWIRSFPPHEDNLRKKGMWTLATSTKKAIEV